MPVATAAFSDSASPTLGTVTCSVANRNSIFYGCNALKTIKYLIAARNDYKKIKMGRIEKEL
jgi:hypothetical protein